MEKKNGKDTLLLGTWEYKSWENRKSIHEAICVEQSGKWSKVSRTAVSLNIDPILSGFREPYGKILARWSSVNTMIKGQYFHTAQEKTVTIGFITYLL